MVEWDSNYVEIDGKYHEKEVFFEGKILRDITKESEKYPLLTRNEEQALIKRYQHSRDAVYAEAQRVYGKEKYPDPSSWTTAPERAVIRAVVHPRGSHYDEGARLAREKMVLHNLRLLKKFGKTNKMGDLGPFECWAAGLNGILHSLDKFDSSKTNGDGEPNKFSTYAVWWIKQEVRRNYVNEGRTIRIPIHVHDEIAKLGKIYAQLSSEYFDCPSPTAEQLSKASGIPVEHVKLLGMYRADFSITSLDKENFAGDEDDSGTLLDSVGAQEELQPEYIAEKELNKQKLNDLIDSVLAPADAKFCKLFYGLIDGSPRSVREMASVLNKPRKDIQEKVDRIMFTLQVHANRDEFSMGD